MSTVPGVHVERAAGVVLRDGEVVFGGDRRDDLGSVLTTCEAPDLVVEGLGGRPARPGLSRVDRVSASPGTRYVSEVRSGEDLQT